MPFAGVWELKPLGERLLVRIHVSVQDECSTLRVDTALALACYHEKVRGEDSRATLDRRWWLLIGMIR
jgi:hypothetical protein